MQCIFFLLNSYPLAHSDPINYRYTHKQIATLYAEATGKQAQIETGAPFPLPLFDANMIFDNSKAKKVLRWTPTHICMLLFLLSFLF